MTKLKSKIKTLALTVGKQIFNIPILHTKKFVWFFLIAGLLVCVKTF